MELDGFPDFYRISDLQENRFNFIPLLPHTSTDQSVPPSYTSLVGPPARTRAAPGVAHVGFGARERLSGDWMGIRERGVECDARYRASNGVCALTCPAVSSRKVRKQWHGYRRQARDRACNSHGVRNRT